MHNRTACSRTRAARCFPSAESLEGRRLFDTYTVTIVDPPVVTPPPNAIAAYLGEQAYAPTATVSRRIRRGVLAKVDWGDGTTVERVSREAVVVSYSLDMSMVELSPQVTHEYANEGVYTATVTYRYRGRRIFRDSQPFYVQRNSPGGQTLNLVVDRPFDGAIGTIPTPKFDAASTSGLIDWGDGTARSPAAFESLDDGSIRVSDSHTYAGTGTYRVAVYVPGGDTIGNKTFTVPVPVLRSTAAVSAQTSPRRAVLLGRGA